MSSEFKYFYIFQLKPSRSVFGFISLKKSVIIFTFIPVLIFITSVITDFFLHIHKTLYIFLKHITYDSLNYIAFVYMVKSLSQFEYKQAYLGNLFFIWAWIIHCICFIINLLCRFNFSSIWFYYFTKGGDWNAKEKQLLNFLFFTIPNFVFIAFELGASWVCYSYTKNWSEGNDALCDGESFDRYIDYLGSDDESKPSSKNGDNSIIIKNNRDDNNNNVNNFSNLQSLKEKSSIDAEWDGTGNINNNNNNKRNNVKINDFSFSDDSLQ